ncbi:MAG: transcriptional repressor [Nitrospiraceae bacterium]|nr:transcriptional repressor [Nitrospiraceae bacterium]
MEEKVFREFLDKKGLKYTQEREAVLREVFSNHNHFDPEEILIKMRQKGIRVSRASIYRTLPLMIECGLVGIVGKTDKQTFYEHTFGHEHHDHVICIGCGKVISIFSEKIEELQAKLCKDKNFIPVTHTLEIKGYCSKCNKKK